jgi:hypothetical protein
MGLPFSRFERFLAFLAGLTNLVIGTIFFFHLAVPLHIWPEATAPSPILSHFIGAIILGNAAGAFMLARERDWLRVRPLVVVAIVYGAVVAGSLLYDAFQSYFNPIFWGYLAVDVPFLIVYLLIFLRHERSRSPASAASLPASDAVRSPQ